MIEFIHPALRNYRVQLFEKLNKKYSIKFIFTEQQETKEFGGVEIPQSWKYENINVTNSLANWLRLTRALLKDNYELILTSPAEAKYNVLALIVSKLRFKKIIFWGESWYWPSNTVVRKLYFHFLFKWLLEQGDAIIAMGEKQYAFYANVLKRKTGIFYAPKYVIPYKKRDASKLIERLAIEDRKILGKKIILYMSQIIKRKGLDYLIRAFRLLEDKVDNIYLLIVGSGPFEGYCRKLAKELGVRNIMFKGYVPESEIELYHNLCNVLVLPSIFLDDYPEPNGYVLYESMSVGKPLVVTDAVGATPELVRNGKNGFVVKNRNTDELVGALFRIVTDENLEEKMSIKSKEIFEEKVSLERQFETFKTAVEYVQK
jgi:glycosyltransferase involved in cell wall biosynthesis